MDFLGEVMAAKSGRIYNHIGLKSNPFIIFHEDLKGTFINRINERTKFARSFAGLLKGEILHIPILGSHGIGKTHFLKFMYSEVEENKSAFGLNEVNYISGESELKLFISNYKAGLDKFVQQKFVLFIDDLDIATMHNPALMRDFFYDFAGKIIGTWNLRAWENIKRRNDIKIPKSDAIVLLGLEEQELKKIIFTRLEKSSSDYNLAKQHFNDEVVEVIVFKSQGVPYSLISACQRYLDILMAQNGEGSIAENIEFFKKSINIVCVRDIRLRTSELTSTQKKILKKIIELEEVSAVKLSEVFGFTRSAAVQHLKLLESKDLIEGKEKENSKIYYAIPAFADDIYELLEKEEVKNELN